MIVRRPCIAAILIAVVSLSLLGCSNPSAPPISVQLSPSSPQVTDQGQTVTISAVVSHDPSGKGVTWSLTGAGSLNSSVGASVIYSPPSGILSSAEQATITATSLTDSTKSASVKITVNLHPLIQPLQTFANGSVGVPYSQTIVIVGGTPPFEWSIYNGPIITGNYVGGSVPDGLTLNASTGTISGTPTGAGTWYFEATATDATGVTAIDGFLNIQINPIAPPGNPVPFLNQPLVPTAVLPGSASFVMNVSGTGFASGTTVDFNGSALATTFVDNEHLRAVVPAADVVNAGTASITVVNPAPGGGQSNVVYFQISAPEAAVTFMNAANSQLQVPSPFGISVGDFNEDGKADLVVAGTEQLYIYIGSGSGTFTPATGSPLPLPSPPYSTGATPFAGPIVVGDFDNSGHLGLAVGETNLNQAAVILLGQGDGTFAPSSAAFAKEFGAPLSGLAAADFNSDGNLDLGITSEFSGVSPVALGYGKGAFNTASDLFTQIFPTGVAVGDFNQDGKLDAIVTSGGSTVNPDSGITVSLGNGDGTFVLANGSPLPLGQNLSAIVAGDFNGDGRLDIAATDATANTVTILLGNGDGTFGVPTTIAIGSQPGAIIAADFNNDGKLDLATANYGDGTVTLLLGKGDGTFTEALGSPYAVGQGPSALAAADFNGDGKLDLAVALASGGPKGTGAVSILLQQ